MKYRPDRGWKAGKNEKKAFYTNNKNVEEVYATYRQG